MVRFVLLAMENGWEIVRYRRSSKLDATEQNSEQLTVGHCWDWQIVCLPIVQQVGHFLPGRNVGQQLVKFGPTMFYLC